MKISDQIDALTFPDAIELRYNAPGCSAWIALTSDQAQALLEWLPGAIATTQQHKENH
ncbi:Uncharacterised protein [Mycobacteroides abscessus]|nr:Uncharacterised protein [Mycobacteroides abscessus]CPW85677.1 Uncharacterised protein [Mycobacteroides abscessus]